MSPEKEMDSSNPVEDQKMMGLGFLLEVGKLSLSLSFCCCETTINPTTKTLLGSRIENQCEGIPHQI
jgi:hypothetical protein